MKKPLIIFLSVLCVMMTACSGSTEVQSDGIDNIEDYTENAAKNCTVYICNEELSGFDIKQVEIENLSQDEILNALISCGVLNEDIKITAFEVKKVDGKETIEVDFNSEFSDYIANYGSSSEYYLVGSVCNTFLEAYECEQIKITVEGEVLSTGHTDYPGYMGLFK